MSEISEKMPLNKRLAAAIAAVESAQKELIALTCDLVRRVTDPLFAQAQALFADGWRYTFYEGYWESDGDGLGAYAEESYVLTWRGWDVTPDQLPVTATEEERAEIDRYLLDLTSEAERPARWETEKRMAEIAADHHQAICSAWRGRYKVDGKFYPSPYVETVMGSVAGRVLRVTVDPGYLGRGQIPVPPEELMGLVVALKVKLEAFGYQVVIEQKGEEEE